MVSTMLCGRDGEIGLAEVAFFVFTGRGRFRHGRGVGREAGGEVFRALDFAFVAGAVEDGFFGGFIAQRLGAGVAGGTVGALDVGRHSATGTEPVAAAAAGKVTFAHNQ